MENVILIVHLLLALALIGIVLLQRSEGGGLGIGGGGGGAMAARSQTTPVQKLTWLLAIAFICTSVTLTVMAAQNAGGQSVVDRIGNSGASSSSSTSTDTLDTDALLPPPSTGDGDAPLVPRAD